MDEQGREQAFMSALVAQHFDLRSAASATISESSSRASLYLFSLSSALVALGFSAQRGEAFTIFAAAVLPAIFLLGLFTFVRVCDTAIENVNALRSIVRIRRFYSSLTPEAGRYFDVGSRADDTEAAMDVMATNRSWVGVLFTTGTMIAALNSMVAGVGVTLLLNATLQPAYLLVSVGTGFGVAVVLVVAAIFYQWRRFLTLFA